jgi:hypothetical protein
MGSKQFSNCLQVLHHCHFDHLHLQYLYGIHSRRNSDPSVPYEPFGTFDDQKRYGGFVPSSKWLREMYDNLIEEHGQEMDQKTAMCTAEICTMDHSHKITKQIVKINGETVFSATLTVTNEFGEICILAFVATKSHAQFESALIKMRESLQLYGHAQPKVFYTDNPAADKHFLENLFPSLKEDVIPVETHSGLKKITRPSDVNISVQSSASGVEAALEKITDDLDLRNDDASIVVGFDAEWNVYLNTGGSLQPTAIVHIAYKKWINIFQVC